MPEITLVTVESNKTLRIYGQGFSQREDDAGEPMPVGYHIQSIGGFPGSPPFTFDGIINALYGTITGTDIDISMVTETGGYEFWTTDQFLGDSNKFAFVIPATNTPWTDGVRPVGPAGTA